VALLPTEIPASREPGLRLNPQLWRIPAEMRAELTSGEIAMSGSYLMTCCAIRGAKALRTPPTKCAGQALFDEDAVCTERILADSEKGSPEAPCRAHPVT
jgi:hypothetical protein